MTPDFAAELMSGAVADEVRAAVAAERARCAAVCREVRLSRDGDDERAAAEACAEAIERGEVSR